uniref:(California timema) hypothetical protein n=1 Tax=Timema californicum TaxID=61474 RepID=A0A7R9PFY0_TIMCA|nr:unnamed protein product [Timema californicum]
MFYINVPAFTLNFDHSKVIIYKTRYNALRESTPPLGAGDSLTTNEEITHLRRQMAKMNRRMMALELDSLQRQQREKFLYAFGLAYFILKTVLWLGRS